MSSPMEKMMNISEHLERLERSLLTHAVRSDADRVSELLADEFREFGSSGRTFTKDQIIALLREESPSTPSTLTDFHASSLSEHSVLVTYRTQRDVQGAQLTASLRFSIWVFREERWQILFHQGTSATQPPLQR